MAAILLPGAICFTALTFERVEMTVKEYNKIYSKVGMCKCVVGHLEEILRDGDMKRLQSLVPDDFVQIVDEALDMYLTHARLQINPTISTLDKLKPFLNWCERTGNEFTSENYQEYLDQKDIDDNVI